MKINARKAIAYYYLLHPNARITKDRPLIKLILLDIRPGGPPLMLASRDDEFIINTKLIMTAAAMFLGLAGVACLFLPDEVLKLYSIDSSSQTADEDI